MARPKLPQELLDDIIENEVYLKFQKKLNQQCLQELSSRSQTNTPKHYLYGFVCLMVLAFIFILQQIPKKKTILKRPEITEKKRAKEPKASMVKEVKFSSKKIPDHYFIKTKTNPSMIATTIKPATKSYLKNVIFKTQQNLAPNNKFQIITNNNSREIQISDQELLSLFKEVPCALVRKNSNESVLLFLAP